MISIIGLTENRNGASKGFRTCFGKLIHSSLSEQAKQSHRLSTYTALALSYNMHNTRTNTVQRVIDNWFLLLMLFCLFVFYFSDLTFRYFKKKLKSLLAFVE